MAVLLQNNIITFRVNDVEFQSKIQLEGLFTFPTEAKRIFF